MKPLFIWVFASVLAFASASYGLPLPPQPRNPQHPGSATYPFEIFEDSLTFRGREIAFFAPKKKSYTPKVPVVVFGHGHTVPLLAYRKTFEHLAGKGIAVIYPQYDTDWSDEDYKRMAFDYVRLVNFALKRYSHIVDPEKVVYSGHSNGAFVALLAAGLPIPAPVHPQALVLFAVAGFYRDYLSRVPPGTAVSLVVGDQDGGTAAALSKKIYDDLNAQHKQVIIVKSYLQTDPQVIADHGFVRTFDWGGARVTPLHYYGSWKFLVGAALDTMITTGPRNPYIYGDLAATTGIPGFLHFIHRSW